MRDTLASRLHSHITTAGTYASDESGRAEVYVQPFPGTGTKFQVSTNGGQVPRWRADGKEIFYTALDGRLMAVPMAASHADTLDVGTPVPLFATPWGSVREPYRAAPDGQQFLISTPMEAATQSVTVIVNWKPKS